MKKFSYKYNVGDIFEVSTGKIMIIKQIRIPSGNSSKEGYLCKCQKDNHEFNLSRHHLDEGNGCPVCKNKIIVRHINDIDTTHPHLTKYFADINDAYTHSYASNKKVLLKCPNCGYEKLMVISSLSSRGHISCDKCSDGFSYPNKFVLNFLTQLNIDFESEKVFDWARNKKYDGYITNKSIIIENHGLGHYKNKFVTYNGVELDDIKKNDNFKENVAKKNGIKYYIKLDCRYSELEYIKNSIMDSKLPNLLNFSDEDINWLKCHEFAVSSRVKEVCDLWNSGITNIDDIYVTTKLSKVSIYKFLKQGQEIGFIGKYKDTLMNNHISKTVKERYQRHAKPIICIDNKMVFGNISILKEVFKTDLNINIPKSIDKVLKGTQKSSKGFTFQYITKEEFNKYKEECHQCYGDFFILSNKNNSKENDIEK